MDVIYLVAQEAYESHPPLIQQRQARHHLPRFERVLQKAGSFQMMQRIFNGFPAKNLIAMPFGRKEPGPCILFAQIEFFGYDLRRIRQIHEHPARGIHLAHNHFSHIGMLFFKRFIDSQSKTWPWGNAFTDAT